MPDGAEDGAAAVFAAGAVLRRKLSVPPFCNGFFHVKRFDDRGFFWETRSL